MTEKEWLIIQDPSPLFNFIEARASDRKFRLFAAACCRRVWEHLIDERSRRAVEIIEMYVDGLSNRSERMRASEEAFQAELVSMTGAGGNRAFVVAAAAAFYAIDLEQEYGRQSHGMALQAATDAAGYPPLPVHEQTRLRARLVERSAQAQLLRDIFGNPFRPVVFSPEWRTSTAIAIASQMYESRDFTAMPILADAFQDAGCDIEDVLTHCRDASAVHVRGCWVVDLVLGKV